MCHLRPATLHCTTIIIVIVNIIFVIFVVFLIVFINISISILIIV